MPVRPMKSPAACRLYRPFTSRRAQTSTAVATRSEEHTSELQSRQYLVYRLLLEKKISGDDPDPSSHSCCLLPHQADSVVHGDRVRQVKAVTVFCLGVVVIRPGLDVIVGPGDRPV